MITRLYRPQFLILAITLLAFALRVYGLDNQSYWLDEIWSVHFANLSQAEMWQHLRTSEAHPPLYHPVTIYWIALVGDSEYGLRFYSVLFSLLAIPLTYRVGRALSNPQIGITAALLISVSPFQIWHAQESRMYSQLTAASLMSMWGFIRLTKQNWTWQAYLIYLTGTIWAMLTHYHGLIVIGIQGLFAISQLFLPTKRRLTFKLFANFLLIFFLYSPWILFSWNLLKGRTSWLTQPSLAESYLRTLITYSVGDKIPPVDQAITSLKLGLMMPFLILYLLGLMYAARRSWRQWRGTEMAVFLLSYTVAPILATWLYGELKANSVIFLERYLIIVQPSYLITIAMGIYGLIRFADFRGLKKVKQILPFIVLGPPKFDKLLQTTALLIVLTIQGWVLYHHYIDPLYAKPDWRAAIAKIDAFAQQGDGIIVTGDGGQLMFQHYYHGHLPIYTDFNTPVPTDEQARQILSDIANQHNRLWYLPYEAPIDSLLENWLHENAHPAWQQWIGYKRLALYDLTNLTDPAQAVNLLADETLSLTHVTHPNEATPAGAVLPISLTWQRQDDLSTEYRLSLRLTNQHGDVFAQNDWPPLRAMLDRATDDRPQTRHALWVPVDTPPNLYQLHLLIYDGLTGQPLAQSLTLPDISISAAHITPPRTTLEIPNPTNLPLGEVALSGYVLPETVRSGENMWAWLYWQCLNQAEPCNPNRYINLKLGDGEGHVVPMFESNAVSDMSDIDNLWQSGQLRRAVYHLPTNPRLTGERVALFVLPADDDSTERQLITELRLDSRPRTYERPNISMPLDIGFGGEPTLLKLIGYDLSQDDSLDLTLYWQARTEMPTNYTIFVQLLNEANYVVAQVDRYPQDGIAPTRTWLSNEIITDWYNLPLSELPTGQYRLLIGLYDATTGIRLMTDQGSDFVELSMLTLRNGD
ncbi:glycosyltransferase family 39 protein [Anaerolineales bacterium HSG24]|nr:glycosyltransferase family 39 protein [Anaerolineales bacterium HSG24]